MNRVVTFAAFTLAAVALAACPSGGDPAPNRLWLDAREGVDPFLSAEQPPRF